MNKNKIKKLNKENKDKKLSKILLNSISFYFDVIFYNIYTRNYNK